MCGLSRVAHVAAQRRNKGGKWAPLFHLLADTGRRVGELVRLRGRDVRREAGVIELGRTKTGEVARVPVPAETMALLPQVEGEAFLWPAQARVNRGAGPGHTSNGAVRAVLRRGLEAIRVPDPERLDTHSLRRAFVATAERAGVATDVGRRVTGHATRAMWDHYQAQAVGDDLHQVVEVVREQRSKVGPASHKPPTAEPSEALESARKSRPAKVAAGAEAQIDFFIRQDAHSPQAESRPNQSHTTPWEATGRSGQVLVGFVGAGRGRQDEALTTLCRWADQDPQAMHRLLTDPELRAQLLQAMADVIGSALNPSHPSHPSPGAYEHTA